MTQIVKEELVRKLVDDMLSSRKFALAHGENFTGFVPKQKSSSRFICGDCDCGMYGCNP